MARFMRSTTRLGNFILKNKGKLLIGVAALAVGGMASLVLSRWKRMFETKIAEPEIAQENRPLVPRAVYRENERSKKDIYRAPPISAENLTKH